MLQFYYKTLRDEKFALLHEPKEGCWIHVDDATSEDLAEISRLSGIDPLDLQDCLDKYEIPRIEKVHQHVLIFTRHPTEQEAGLYTLTLTFIITSHYFITISPQKSHLIASFLAQKNKFSTLQKSKLLINILLKMNHEKF